MQETHSVQDYFLSWQNEWGGDIILNHGSSNSRGTLIAFSGYFKFKI